MKCELRMISRFVERQASFESTKERRQERGTALEINTRSLGRLFASLILLSGGALSRHAMAQEDPEFGSATGTAIEVDAERAPPRKIAKTSKGVPDEEVLAALLPQLAKPEWKWKFIPASTQSSTRSSYGLETRAAHAANEYSLRYVNVDPKGIKGPFDQIRGRVKHAFPELKGSLLVEAQGQYTWQDQSYREPAISANFTKQLSANTAMIFSTGWAWRVPVGKPNVNDYQASIAMKHTFNNKMAVATTYTLQNKIANEDDFTVGLSIAPQITIVVGKHWVTTLSYVHALTTK